MNCSHMCFPIIKVNHLGIKMEPRTQVTHSLNNFCNYLFSWHHVPGEVCCGRDSYVFPKLAYNWLTFPSNPCNVMWSCDCVLANGIWVEWSTQLPGKSIKNSPIWVSILSPICLSGADIQRQQPCGMRELQNERGLHFWITIQKPPAKSKELPGRHETKIALCSVSCLGSLLQKFAYSN